MFPWLVLVPQPVRVCGYILLWYILSIGLTFLNKWMYKSYGLPFPLSITSFHFFYGLVAAAVVRAVQRKWSLATPVTMSLREYVRIMAPAGAFSAMDIGLSNIAVMLIAISLVTVVKSTSLVFILLFSLAFRLEPFRWPLLLVIIAISAGAALFAYDMTPTTDQALLVTTPGSPIIAPSPSPTPNASSTTKESDGVRAVGCLLALIASSIAGLRWVLVQAGVQEGPNPRTAAVVNGDAGDKNDAGEGPAESAAAAPEADLEEVEERPPLRRHGMHPVDAMFYISPTAFVTMVPFAAVLEARSFYHSEKMFGAKDAGTFFTSCFVIVAAANVAFVMTLAEYLLVRRTSSLTFAVAGMVKEVVTILLSVVIFNDTHSALNYAGLAISLAGIGLYNYIKFATARDPAAFTAAEPARAPSAQSPAAADDGGSAWRGKLASATRRTQTARGFLRRIVDRLRSFGSRSNGRAYRSLDGDEFTAFDGDDDADVLFDAEQTEAIGMVPLSNGAHAKSAKNDRGAKNGPSSKDALPVVEYDSDGSDGEETVLWAHGDATSEAPRPAAPKGLRK